MTNLPGDFPRIVQLDTVVANQIAAGEVIERPSSLIKELVENALDAKATCIDITLEGAGVHYIAVRDNGIGIAKADLSLAFSRHATSKIRSSEDLFAIHSLGFRGEALASIASVSRCRLTSCAQGETQAWQWHPHGLRGAEILPAAHSQGTTVEVSDLFYNVPARRRFLRSVKTELQAMDEMLKRLALSHPPVRFKLTHQQRLMRHYPAVSTHFTEAQRIAKICGPHFIANACHIALATGGLSISGWVGLPQMGHRQGDCQYFYINQRMVKDRFIHQIIKTLFQQHPAYVEGTFPCYVLFLTIDPTQIDVNVHPTKQEVRFHQPRYIHDLISKAIREGLSASGHEETTGSIELHTPAPVSIKETPSQSLFASQAMSPRLTNNTTGGLHRRFAYWESGEGVYKIDLQQADKALRSAYWLQIMGDVPTKTLLIPEVLTDLIPGVDLAPLQSVLKIWGFSCQPQGKDWVLYQRPAMIVNFSQVFFQQWLQLCKQGVSNVMKADFLADHIRLSALDALSVRQFEALLQQWISTAIPGTFEYISYKTNREPMAGLAKIPDSC